MIRSLFSFRLVEIEVLEDRSMLSATAAGDGSDLLINTTTSRAQLAPDVAMDANGDFVATWRSPEVVDSSLIDNVRVRRFAADGSVEQINGQSDDIIANKETKMFGGPPRVAMSGDGDFLVTWKGLDENDPFNPNDDIVGIFGRAYDANGNARSATEFLVGQVGVNGDPSTLSIGDSSADADGRFVVTWGWVEIGSPHIRHISGKIFDRVDLQAAVVAGDSIPDIQGAAVERTTSRVAMDSSGEFVIVWAEENDPGSLIRVNRYGPSGMLLDTSPIDVATHSASSQLDIDKNASGDFVVVFGTQSRLYHADGTAKHAAFGLNLPSPIGDPIRVAMDSTGGFAATSANSSHTRINVQTLDASGQQNAYFDEINDEAPGLTPVIASNPSGNFVVLWQGAVDPDTNAGGETEIWGQRFVTPSVTGRHIFYNESHYDGNSRAINANDDNAIAIDKAAYVPGSGIASPSNVTSYSLGINGIMVDILGAQGVIDENDFTFKVGSNDDPGTWSTAPAPLAVAVRPGAGVGGADRVEIVWDNNVIQNQWLMVTVEGNDANGGMNTNTGLTRSDVFFFGNRIGDTFQNSPPTVFVTSSADVVAVQNNVAFGVPRTNIYDFNKDGQVSANDKVTATNNGGFLTRINIAAPLVAVADDDGEDASAVAVALSIPSLGFGAEDEFAAAPLVATAGGEATVPVAVSLLAGDTAESLALATIDWEDAPSLVDDALLDPILEALVA